MDLAKKKMGKTRTTHLPALNLAGLTSVTDINRFLDIIQVLPRVKRHFDLLCWLQGDFQSCLPHEIMLAAWGMPKKASLHIDVVSHLPGIRTASLHHAIKPFMRKLFNKWQENGCRPYRIEMPDGFLPGNNGTDDFVSHAFHEMRTAMVHAIKDERSQHFCVYAALSSTRTATNVLDKMEVLLPYVDTAFRQVPSLPEQCDDAVEDALESLDLSEREAEIMKWVRFGKTNQEIGLILDISAFTVKNHLQRIFRKLDVSNRAQAVAKLRVDGAGSGRRADGTW